MAAEVKTFVLPFQVSRLSPAGWEQRAMEAWRREVRSLALTPVDCWVHDRQDYARDPQSMFFIVSGRVIANA